MSGEVHGFYSVQTAQTFKISKKMFDAYEEVRKSGETNMYDIPRVVELSGGVLTEQQVCNIIRYYDYLKDKYYGVKQKAMFCEYCGKELGGHDICRFCNPTAHG